MRELPGLPPLLMWLSVAAGLKLDDEKVLLGWHITSC